MTTNCRVPDCGAITDAFLCGSCGSEIRRALHHPGGGDPDIPTLIAALSISATGGARVYRAMRRPGEPDEELADLEEEYRWRALTTPANLRSRDGRITLPATRAMVINMAARELLDEAWNELITTMRDLCESHGLDFNAELDRIRSAMRYRQVLRPRVDCCAGHRSACTDEPCCKRCTEHGHDQLGFATGTHLDRAPCIAPDLTQPLPDPPIGPREVADWLADRVNSLRHDDTGPDIHAALIRLRERLLRAVDRAPSRIYTGPCDGTTTDGGRCGRPLWSKFNPFRTRTGLTDDEYADLDDQRVIVCDGYRPPLDPQWDPADEGCGAEYSAQDRHAWLIADIADRLHTIDYWAYWLPLIPGVASEKVPPSVIKSWAGENYNGTSSKPTRARLLPHGLDRDGNELFRGEDVMDLMASYRPKRFAPRPGRAATLSARRVS